jgi:CheY-like chemotaxis protein
MCKVNNVLLIDDEQATNFYNTYVIEEMRFARNIAVVLNGKEALTYLQCQEEHSHREEDCTCPDLIFLDLNMPVMNGFDFLEAFEGMDACKKENVKIYILSSSDHTLDHFKTSLFKSVTGYLTKPLTEETLLGLAV